MKDYERLSRAHFDKQAKDYDERNTVSYSKAGKISCNDITEYLRSYHYDKLLDIGAGTGYLLELLTRQTDAVLFGVDLSEEMVKIAKKKTIKNASFVVAPANRLPFADHTFDVVTCSQSFHHYPYPKEAMREAYRVLKPNGLYILSDTGVGGIGAFVDNKIIFRLMMSGDYHTTNKNGIAKMMKAENFEVIDKYQVRGFIYTVVGKK